MAWQDYADKYTNIPAIFVSIAFNSGTRYYSNDYWRLAGTCYKGKILNFPQIRSSVGDIKRTYERNKIIIVFDDSDYEFRELEDTETVAFKNRTVTISIYFQDDNYTSGLTIFTGQIFDWERLENLRYALYIEEESTNLDNEYPWKRVELTDYANAHETAIGWTIPIPYGSISALGLSGDGAFGHPSLSSEGHGTGLPFVDTTVDSEKHLVGLQAAAITVDRVYKDGALQTAGAGNDYQISTQVIDGFTHTEIHWEAGNRPTEVNQISCDITFGSRRPVEAIKHFLENFCGYAAGDFNAASYNVAHDKETDRDYQMDGALWEKKTLRSILDVWRSEWELDIYWNKGGEICFNYLSSLLPASINTYEDYLEILEQFKSDPNVDKLINYIKYGYNFNYAKTYFYNYSEYEDTDSQTKYGGTFKAFEGFYWIRNSTVAQDIAARKIIRFKDPIVFDLMKFPLKTYSDDLTDYLKITHFLGLGDGGYDEKLFQIRDTQYNLNDFTNEMLLEDVSNFAGAACILGDGDVLPATWALAVGAQRDYCYLCDATTGQFSDGEPGKKLLD